MEINNIERVKNYNVCLYRAGPGGGQTGNCHLSVAGLFKIKDFKNTSFVNYDFSIE